jgi:hypothetical protein
MKDGVVLARFAHRRCGKTAVGRGQRSRESIEPPRTPLMRQHGSLAGVRWNGVAMVEFKIDEGRSPDPGGQRQVLGFTGAAASAQWISVCSS